MTHPIPSFRLSSLGTCSRRCFIHLLAGLFATMLFVFSGLQAGAAWPEAELAAFDDFTGKRLPVARLTLDARGFTPASISRPKGPFILAIHNRSKIDDLNLSLSKVTGNKLREMNFRKQKLDWRSFITLPPGDYVLSVTGRPQWVCNIEIKGN